MLFRKARQRDIGLLCAEYGRAVCEWGFGPIPDMDAVITASVADRALVLPHDIVFGVDNAKFNVDVTIGQTAKGEFAGFYVRKKIVQDGSHTAPAAPFGIATELWYLAVSPNLRGLGVGTRLVRDALTLTHSETAGRGGLLARVTGLNCPITQILQSQGFLDLGTTCWANHLWMYPSSNHYDQFAEIVDRR